MCKKQNDKWGEDVKLRLAGILNDIVALDGSYNKDCKRDFFLSFYKNEKKQSEKDYSFKDLVVTIRSERTRI